MTQTPIGILTKHFLNAISKIKKEKKQQVINKRVLQIYHGSFTPLEFSIYGGMGRKCSTFYNRLTKKIAEKQELYQSTVTNWIQTKISFALLKSALLCLHGSRSPSSKVCFVGNNIAVAHQVAKI